MVRLVSFSLLLCAVSAEDKSDVTTTSALPSTRPAKAIPAWDTWKVKDGAHALESKSGMKVAKAIHLASPSVIQLIAKSESGMNGVLARARV